MIKLSGTLFIRNVIGRNGTFSVGRLVTDIGEFAIKDAMLDQYDEGRYEGEFGISRIYPSSYAAQNRMVIEIRAVLETMALAAIDEMPPPPEAPLTEPDPIESEQAPPVPVEPKAGSEPGHGAQPDPLDLLLDDSDERLFGSLWPLGQSVKLDTTVDRAVFRQQKDRLKELGYRFQPLGQTWQRLD